MTQPHPKQAAKRWVSVSMKEYMDYRGIKRYMNPKLPFDVYDYQVWRPAKPQPPARRNTKTR